MPPDEGHLASLLAGASALASSTVLRERRVAALQVLDYYELILKEAREVMGYTDHPDSLNALANIVAAELPTLTDSSHLLGLGKFRNDLYHDALYNPKPKTLDLYVGSAVKVRAALVKGATDMAARLQAFNQVSKKLLDEANGLKAELVEYGPAGVELWTPIVEEAIALATQKPKEMTVAHVDLLVKIARQRAGAQAEDEALQLHHWELDGEPDEQHDPDYYGDQDHEPDPDYEPPEGYPEPDEPPGEPDESDHEQEPNEEPPEQDQEPDESNHEREPNEEPPEQDHDLDESDHEPDHE